MPRLNSTPNPTPNSPINQPAPKPVFQLPSLLGKTENVLSPLMPQVRLSFGSLGSANTSLSLDPAPRFATHTVKHGETLAKIAKEHLGSAGLYNSIFEANRDQLRNPNDLHIGMTLQIPLPAGGELPAARPPSVKPGKAAGPSKPAVAPPEPQFTEQKVKRGDSLSILALRHLGNSERYQEIYDANRDQLKSPDSLRPGMTLKIPVRNTAPAAGSQRADRTGTTHSVSAADGRGLTSGAQELLGAMQHYKQIHPTNIDGSVTTAAEMREIAIELDAASKTFGVDPKMMLAVFAHESGGINPDARSHTGAGGLGQLTGIAIRQVHYLAGMAKGQTGKSPYTQQKSNFVQSTSSVNQRYNIKANVWTSVAYMSYELNDRASLGRGVEKALKRYGDPHVSTYANKVSAEHKTLFGKQLF